MNRGAVKAAEKLVALLVSTGLSEQAANQYAAELIQSATLMVNSSYSRGNINGHKEHAEEVEGNKACYARLPSW